MQRLITTSLLMLVATSSVVVLATQGAIAAETLPVGSHPPAIGTPHFPDRLHAFVWRNWQLVEPERLAEVLDTSVANVTEVATSMGLPADATPSPLMRSRGYITLIRRNWHLLPYDQLLTLLEMSRQELAYTLREDDFLYIKLGSLKPKCQPLRYEKPDAAATQRAADIRRLVEHHFGDRLTAASEPRFHFVDELSRVDETQTDHAPKGDSAAGLRLVYSYFGVFGDPLADPALDPLPDGLLSRLANVGVNGVWLHVVLRQLAPPTAQFPEFGDGHQTRLANLRTLVDRCRRHGIDVYLYMNEPRAMPIDFFAERREMMGVREGDFATMCTSNPQVRQWLGDSLEHVFVNVPHLGGVFTITASENLTSCASHFRHADCPRCAGRSEAQIIAEVNATIEAGVHRGNPAARVIAWDWGWNKHREAPDTIALLPERISLMSVSEWSLPIERGGVRSTVGEYSISAVGPGPRATQNWASAAERGLKTVAKVQLSNTWELSAVPFLPVLDLVAEHCENLAAANVEDMMLSWSLGGYPSPNLQIAHHFSTQSGADKQSALDAVATQRYGADAAPHARRAWTEFSNAFREYPYSGAVLYNGPQQLGPANLLHAAPTGYRATMVGFPYDDVDGWRGPYPADVLAAQFARVATGWAAGLEHLEQVVAATTGPQQTTAQRDLYVASAAQVHFASVANQVRFVLARDALAANESRDEDDASAQRAELRGQLRQLLADETALALRLHAITQRDSRIGFEATNQYYYVPLDLVEKVINCDFIRAQLRDASGER